MSDFEAMDIIPNLNIDINGDGIPDPFLAPSVVGSNNTSAGKFYPVDGVTYNTSSGGNCVVRCGSNNICKVETNARKE